MKKLSKDDLKRRDELVQKLATAFAEVETVYDEVNTLIIDKLSNAVGKYNDILGEVASFRDEIVGKMDEYVEERSDKWRESDAGENYESWKADWENFSTEELEVPDGLDAPEGIHSDELEALEMEAPQ